MQILQSGSAGTVSIQPNDPRGSTMTIVKSRRVATSALLLSSAVFLTACSSLNWPGKTTDTAAQADTKTVESPQAGAEDTGMAMDKMPMEGMQKDGMAMADMDMSDMDMTEMREKCMAMHDDMMAKMSEGHAGHGGGMKDGDGMMMSPEMKEMHEKCMEAMPEMQEKHDRCMQMKHDGSGEGMMSGDGMMDGDKMQQMHQHCMQKDDASAAGGDAPAQAEPHSHDHSDGGS